MMNTPRDTPRRFLRRRHYLPLLKSPGLQRIKRFTVVGVGLALSACGSTTSPPAATVTVTAPEQQPSVASSASQPSSYAAPTPTGPKSVIGTDGTYLVGTDILPGMY